MSAAQPSSASEPAMQPIWPLPDRQGLKPIILTRPGRRAVELAYERTFDPNPQRVQPICDADLSRFEIYYRTPVFAVFAGTVVEATPYRIVLQHKGAWCSVYGQVRYPRLRFTFQRDDDAPPQHVEQGRVIGYVGGEMELPVMPLKFQLFRYFKARRAWVELDPIRNLEQWRLEEWLDDVRPPFRCLTLAELGARIARQDAEKKPTRDPANACAKAA